MSPYTIYITSTTPTMFASTMGATYSVEGCKIKVKAMIDGRGLCHIHREKNDIDVTLDAIISYKTSSSALIMVLNK